MKESAKSDLRKGHSTTCLQTERPASTRDRTHPLGNYSNITDLSGIRIIAFYESDVEKICQIINNNFRVDYDNSVSKIDNVSPDRFGYISHDYIVSHNDARTFLQENMQFEGMKAEIQIRTVLQHAWAAIDRKLRYNNETDIPVEIRRKLFRVSALLELADKEFSEINDKIASLRETYRSDVEKGQLNLPINADSLEIFIDGSDIASEIIKTAERVGIGLIQRKDNSVLVPQLKNTLEVANIRTINELDSFIRKILSRSTDIFDALAKNPAAMGSDYTPYYLIAMAAVFTGGNELLDEVLSKEIFPAPTVHILTMLRKHLITDDG